MEGIECLCGLLVKSSIQLYTKSKKDEEKRERRVKEKNKFKPRRLIGPFILAHGFRKLRGNRGYAKEGQGGV
jgi:hypothetical protein